MLGDKNFSKHDLDEFFDSYVETALWSSTDESDESGGDPLDKNYGAGDIAAETKRKMAADCKRFLTKAWPLLAECRLRIRGVATVTAAGHDFWLTRNGHGAGFWDGDWPDEIGDKLDKMCKSFGHVDLYLGDNGKIYQSP